MRMREVEGDKGQVGGRGEGGTGWGGSWAWAGCRGGTSIGQVRVMSCLLPICIVGGVMSPAHA